jgi:hypothetical protein
VRNHLVRLRTCRCGSSSLSPRTTARLEKSSSSGYSSKRQRRFQSVSAYLKLARPAKRRSFILVDGVIRSRRPGEMAGVHRNTKGLRCLSFRSLTKSLDTCLGAVTELPNSLEPCRPTRRRSAETGQQQSASVSWSQTTEIVGGRFQGGTSETATI